MQSLRILLARLTAHTSLFLTALSVFCSLSALVGAVILFAGVQPFSAIAWMLLTLLLAISFLLVILALAFRQQLRLGPITIPIMIDAIRDTEGTPMARTIYFVVTSDAPNPGWTLELSLLAHVPLQLLGQTGVIYHPGNSSDLFRSPEDLDRVIAAIETDQTYSIENEDLWTPIDWFKVTKEPERGDVYRLTFSFFKRAYRFRDGQMPYARFMQAVPPSQTDLKYSPRETRAIHSWNERQIERSHEHYHANEHRALTWSQA